jgi:hypothetical protein
VKVINRASSSIFFDKRRERFDTFVMREIKSNPPQDPLLQIPSLSRVSFQHGLRSAGGPEFGQQLVAKELASLRQRGDVTFDLSSKQAQHYLEACDFLEKRYTNLGLRFDPGSPPFVYTSPRDGKGICMTLSRSPGVLYEKGESRDRYESVSLWVHELTHATASVVWGAERDSAKPSGWRFTISRAGCMLRPKASGSLGIIFEEYAACANQSLYIFGLDSTKEVREEKLSDLPFDRRSEVDLKLFKVFKRICDPAMYAETENSGEPRAWERAFVRDNSTLEVSFEVLSWRNASGYEGGSVYPVALLDRLAGEIFPEIPPAVAAERLRDISVRAQVTGEMPELLVPIREALGQDALLFLLEWGQNLSHIASGEESAALSLFVSAGSLGREQAQTVRRELRDALNEKRKKGEEHNIPEAVKVERLLYAGERDEWSSWLDTRSATFVKGDPDLQAYAAARLSAALEACDFSQVAEIFVAAGFSDERRPRASIKRLSQHSRELLGEGRVRAYERIVDVFKPERALVPRTEARRLIHDAAVKSLRGGLIGVFCEVATSSLCDREVLLSLEVRRLAQAKLKGTMSFMSRLRLERALEGESLPD